MNYTDLFIVIGVAFLVTLLYIVFRKFIRWAIEDNNKFYTKNGCSGASKKGLERDKKWAVGKLTQGYALIMILLIIYIIYIMKSILEAA